jgi:hypothetical protein
MLERGPIFNQGRKKFNENVYCKIDNDIFGTKSSTNTSYSDIKSRAREVSEERMDNKLRVVI